MLVTFLLLRWNAPMKSSLAEGLLLFHSSRGTESIMVEKGVGGSRSLRLARQSGRRLVTFHTHIGSREMTGSRVRQQTLKARPLPPVTKFFLQGSIS